MNYDLEDRTTRFAIDVINFCKTLKVDVISKPIISQLIRSASSVGANYREANEASSKRDFRNKISISKKEANETRHWLRLIKVACPESEEQSHVLLKEITELTLIFGAIFKKLN